MSSDWPSLSDNSRRWLRLGMLLLIAVVLGWVVVDLRGVLTPIAVALALAYVFHPLVYRLERRGVPRLAAVIGLYAFGLVVVIGLGFWLTSVTIVQALALRENIDSYMAAARAWLGPVTSAPAALSGRADWWQEVGPALREHGVALATATLAWATGLVSNILNWISIFILIPLFGFFFLWRFDDLLRAVRDHLPARVCDTIVHVAVTADRSIASFFRGRLIACALIGLVTGIGWTLVGVSYGLPLGALAGLLSLVPFLSVLALPPALLMRYLDAVHAGLDWKWPIVLTMGVYLAVQGLEAFVLTPLIQSRSSGLHFLTTVLALLIGAHWAGLLGALLAVPIASTLKVLAAEYLWPEVRRAAGAPPPAEREPAHPEKRSS